MNENINKTCGVTAVTTMRRGEAAASGNTP